MNDQKFKADAGKAMPDLASLGFARAIRAMQATLEYGAKKYEAHSWRDVPDAINRYSRAGERHRQARQLDWLDMGNNSILGSRDAESGLPHSFHELFNLAALIELQLTEYCNTHTSAGTENQVLLDIVRGMKEPPQDHKEGTA